MSYHYVTERPVVFTEEGQVMLIKIRDKAKALHEKAGAFTVQKLIAEIGGDSWHMLACIDRLAEIGDIAKVADGRWSQDAIYKWIGE